MIDVTLDPLVGLPVEQKEMWTALSSHSKIIYLHSFDELVRVFKEFGLFFDSIHTPVLLHVGDQFTVKYKQMTYIYTEKESTREIIIP